MLFIGNPQKTPRVVSVFEFVDELVEHHFAKRVRRTEPFGDDSHRPIAVAAECRLDDGKIEFDVA